MLILRFLMILILSALYQHVIAKQITIGNSNEPSTLDPALVTTMAEIRLANNLFEGLVGLDPITLKPIPAQAKSWDISDDGREYTFYLRDNLKWSDGKNISAEEFIWSFRRALNKKLGSAYAYQYFVIKGAKELYESVSQKAPGLGVSAPNSKTLSIKLERPIPYFLELLSTPTFYPVPRHVLNQNPYSPLNLRQLKVSNGPYRLKGWNLNQAVRLEANPHYWQAKSIAIKDVNFLGIEDIQLEEKMFRNREINITSGVPADKLPRYSKLKSTENKNSGPLTTSGYLATYFYSINTKKPPLNDPKVRMALALSIDRNIITSRVTKSGERPATSLTPSGINEYQRPEILPSTLRTRDIQKAKNLLKQAGFPEGKGFPKLELLYFSKESHKKIALAVQQMWKKNLNIEVSLYNQEFRTVMQRLRLGDYQICSSTWIGDFVDPTNFLDLLKSNSGNNRTGWKNDRFDKLMKEASRIGDQKIRYKMLSQAESILMSEVPVIPVYEFSQNRLVDPELKIEDSKGVVHAWQSNVRGLYLVKHYRY